MKFIIRTFAWFFALNGWFWLFDITCSTAKAWAIVICLAIADKILASSLPERGEAWVIIGTAEIIFAFGGLILAVSHYIIWLLFT